MSRTRPILTPRDVLAGVPARFHPLYRVVTGICQFQLSGPGGGDIHTVCRADRIEVHEGLHPSPQCTVRVPAQDFVGWCVGQLRDHDLLEAGRLRIAGDPELLFSMVMLLHAGLDEDLRAAIEAVDARFTGRAMPARIERLSSLSRAQLREASRAGTPFLLVGGTDDWPARAWTIDSLRRRFGHVPFPVRRASASSPWVSLLPLDVRGGARGTMRLGDFLDLVLASSAAGPGVPNTDLMTLPAALAAELGPLPAFPEGARTREWPELFLSAAGAYTGVHRDFEDGASCVFVGRRRFRLWSPDQARRLYAMPNHPPQFQACFLDARGPDRTTFPLFDEAVAVEVVVEPGDVLYIPFGWFHDVAVLEHGLTIRFDYPHDLHRYLG